MNGTQSRNPINEKNERVPLTGVLAEFRDALEQEIAAVENSGHSSTQLENGRRIPQNGADVWYRFDVKYMPNIPNDTPCILKVCGTKYNVTVIGCDENEITVALKEEIAEPLGKATLENGSTALLKRQIARIEERAKEKNDLGIRMLSNSFRKISDYKYVFRPGDSDDGNEPNEEQKGAIEKAIAYDISFVWGPPGTGKSTVIGQLVKELLEQGRSVLITSHTNNAVDGAIQKADKAYAKNHVVCPGDPYPILRLGNTTANLEKRLLEEYHKNAQGKELYERRHEIEKELERNRKILREIEASIAKCVWVRENKLKMIASDLKEMGVLDKEKEGLNREKSKAEKATNKNSPNALKSLYREKNKIELNLGRVRNQTRKVEEEAGVCREAVLRLMQRIQRGENEITKHNRYQELKEEEKGKLSSEYLREQIRTAEYKQEELRSERTAYIKCLSAARQFVGEYERKNKLGQFLAGKSKYETARQQIEDLERKVSECDRGISVQGKLIPEWEKELQDALLLKERIRACTPQNTKKYWSEQISQWNKELRSEKQRTAELEEQEKKLQNELKILDETHERALQEIAKLEREKKELLEINLWIEEVERKIEEKQRSVRLSLAHEWMVASAFFNIAGTSNLKEMYSLLSAELARCKQEIQRKSEKALLEEKEAVDNRIKKDYLELQSIDKRIREIRKEIINSVQVIGATLTKAYTCEELQERKFDTVIIDEASMAAVTALWCASYLAEKHIVIIGDFLQLPPVVLAGDEADMAGKWLATNVFCHAGIRKAAEKQNIYDCPDNFTVLFRQFRMDKEIADIANMYYGKYHELVSNDESRKMARVQFLSWYPEKEREHSVRMIDTGGLHAWVTSVPRGESHSRFNSVTASLDVNLAVWTWVWVFISLTNFFGQVFHAST